MKLNYSLILFIILSFDLIKIYLNSQENNILNSNLKKSSELNTLKEKEMSKVEAEVQDLLKFEEKGFTYDTKTYFKKLFSMSTPMSKCSKENCQYCCLSLNFCGSKKQCENSENTMNILKIMFFSISFILLLFLIYKIWITDPESEHTESDKIQDGALNLLIGLFIYNRENRRKFRY